jgi:hypothetical protein
MGFDTGESWNLSTARASMSYTARAMEIKIVEYLFRFEFKGFSKPIRQP